MILIKKDILSFLIPTVYSVHIFLLSSPLLIPCFLQFIVPEKRNENWKTNKQEIKKGFKSECP